MSNRARNNAFYVTSTAIGGKPVDIAGIADGMTLVFDAIADKFKTVSQTAIGVTFEALDSNGDVGAGATQVARGNHNHDANYEQKNANIQAHIADTISNPHNVDKSDVGLASVDNTADLQKPVSVLQQSALDLKVDKVIGKVLSSNDFTDLQKTKLTGIAENANNYSHPATHPATMIAEDATHRFVTDSEKSAWNSGIGTGSANPDGGNANSVYVATQLIDGGTA